MIAECCQICYSGYARPTYPQKEQPVLGAILRTIIELHGTHHWPEVSLLLWTILEKYRQEIRLEVIDIKGRREG